MLDVVKQRHNELKKEHRMKNDLDWERLMKSEKIYFDIFQFGLFDVKSVGVRWFELTKKRSIRRRHIRRIQSDD